MGKTAKQIHKYTIINRWYAKGIGYRINDKGKSVAKVHYLAKVADDPRCIQADLRAAQLKAQWQAIRATGGNAWPKDQATAAPIVSVAARAVAAAITGSQSRKAETATDPLPLKVREAVGGTGKGGSSTHAISPNSASALVSPTPHPLKVTTPQPPLGFQVAESQKTFGDLVPLYLSTLVGKSHGHYITTRDRLAFVGRVMVNGGSLNALPLSALDEDALTAVVKFVASRPPSSRKGKKPIGISYANACNKWLRYCLHWAHCKSFWTEPRNFQEIFKEALPKMLPLESDARLKLRETQGDDGKYWPIDQLALIYGAAPDRVKLWMGLSLNCGMGAGELHTLRRAEIVGLDGKAPYIHRHRWKTTRSGTRQGVYAKWGFLFPETVELLKRFIKEDGIGPDDFVIKTSDGERLVKETFEADGKPKARYDAYYVIWQAALKRAKTNDGPKRLPPKYLRKTGARLIRHMDGIQDRSQLATMYLSHGDDSDDTLLGEHYSERDWELLTPALRRMYEALKPMFAAQPRMASERMEDARKRNMEKARLAALAKRKARKEMAAV